MYTVTYHECEATTLEAHNAIMALPTEEVELDDIIDACQTSQANAELSDAAGFSKGWVHADGNYQLR